jgi:ribulose-5-phosphate 4-epimerase/fuculose-1-phosphate aldolase
VPVFDIAELYREDEPQNLLVSNAKFGASLAAKFSSNENPSSISPDHSVVLMKKHGFTTLGTNVPGTVFRALYTQTNAEIQMSAQLLQNAMNSEDFGGLDSLSATQARDCQEMNEGTQERPWALWVREVEACPLYVNKLSNMV